MKTPSDIDALTPLVNTKLTPLLQDTDGRMDARSRRWKCRRTGLSGRRVGVE